VPATDPLEAVFAVAVDDAEEEDAAPLLDGDSDSAAGARLKKWM
jgi:hypothetical protein